MTHPRVLIVSDLYPTGGSPLGGSFVMDRIEALTNNGAQVTAVALRPRPTATLRGALKLTGRSLGQPVRSVFRDAFYSLGPAGYVQTTRGVPPAGLVGQIADRVLDATEGQTFDIIHAHGMYRVKAGAIARELSKRLHVPFVLTVHGSDVNINMRRDPGSFVATFRDAASVIYVSEALRDAAIALGAPIGNARVIPNGVDTDLFRPGQKDTAAPVVTFVGGLAPVKGADRLPAIFAGVAARVPGARFEVVGSGGLRTRLEDEMEALDVTFHGHVDRAAVAEIMARTSVLVVPSRSEGWGCVVLEAQAAGAIAVATRVGGLVESVGDERFLAPDEGGVEAMVERVVRVLLTPPRPLRARALGYRWDRLAMRELETYRSAMGTAL